jgi:hypothetical protein
MNTDITAHMSTMDYIRMFGDACLARIKEGHRLQDLWTRYPMPVSQIARYFANDRVFQNTPGYSLQKGLMVCGPDAHLLMEVFTRNPKQCYVMIDVTTIGQHASPDMKKVVFIHANTVPPRDKNFHQEREGHCFYRLGEEKETEIIGNVMYHRCLKQSTQPARLTHLCSNKTLEELETIYTAETISHMLDMCNLVELK